MAVDHLPPEIVTFQLVLCRPLAWWSGQWPERRGDARGPVAISQAARACVAQLPKGVGSADSRGELRRAHQSPVEVARADDCFLWVFVFVCDAAAASADRR